MNKLVEHIVNEDVASLEEAIDGILRRKIDEVLFAEEERIDELDQETVQSYAKKAVKSQRKAKDAAWKAEDRAVGAASMKTAEKNLDAAQKNWGTAAKREAGLRLAKKNYKVKS